MALTVDANGNFEGKIGDTETIGIDGTATRIQSATYAGQNATIAADGRSISFTLVDDAQLLQIMLLTPPGVYETIHFFPFVYAAQPLAESIDIKVLSGNGGDPYQNTVICNEAISSSKHQVWRKLDERGPQHSTGTSRMPRDDEHSLRRKD